MTLSAAYEIDWFYVWGTTAIRKMMEAWYTSLGLVKVFLAPNKIVGTVGSPALEWKVALGTCCCAASPLPFK